MKRPYRKRRSPCFACSQTAISRAASDKTLVYRHVPNTPFRGQKMPTIASVVRLATIF